MDQSGIGHNNSRTSLGTTKDLDANSIKRVGKIFISDHNNSRTGRGTTGSEVNSKAERINKILISETSTTKKTNSWEFV